ncbi:MAG: hypothetical protein ACOYYS_25635 [Chloroflexota bacterium]
MSENKNRNQQKSVISGDLLREMGDYFRLVLRLMADGRVNPLLKLLPIGGVVYMISPLDAMIPYVDDLGVIGLAMYMFVEMCPPAVVAEHRQALRGANDPAVSEPGNPAQDDDVIDVEFREER